MTYCLCSNLLHIARASLSSGKTAPGIGESSIVFTHKYATLSDVEDWASRCPRVLWQLSPSILTLLLRWNILACPFHYQNMAILVDCVYVLLASTFRYFRCLCIAEITCPSEATHILKKKWGPQTQTKTPEICPEPVAKSPGKCLRLKNWFSYLTLPRVLRLRPM